VGGKILIFFVDRVSGVFGSLCVGNRRAGGCGYIRFSYTFVYTSTVAVKVWIVSVCLFTLC
jgi:hypothetical protein